MFFRTQNGIQTQSSFANSTKTKVYEVASSSLNFKPLTKKQAITNQDLVNIATTIFVKGHNNALYKMFSK